MSTAQPTPAVTPPALVVRPPHGHSARHGRIRLLALLAVCAGLVGAGAAVGLLFAVGAVGRTTREVTTVMQAQVPTVSSAGSAAELYAAAAPGVVDISAHVVTQVQTPFGPRSETATESGAGSVVDLRGDIVTAAHVVEGATRVSVKLADGSTRKARVLGRDSAIDVAVLKIEPSGVVLHPLVLGSLRSLRIGDRVFAIGDPFGYARSFSNGLVSGLDRTIEAPNGFLVAHAVQTDAALNPGNSGGPLLDVRGRVIGVVDQIATGGTGAETNTGVGFAVPVDLVKSVLSQLELGRTPVHAYLGVAASDATDGGALVQSVRKGSPAAAGLKAGDVIAALGVTKISGASDLVAAVAAHRAGDVVTLTVRRGARQFSVRLTLSKQPATADGG
jgi:putative serine protease PepD